MSIIKPALVKYPQTKTLRQLTVETMGGDHYGCWESAQTDQHRPPTRDVHRRGAPTCSGNSSTDMINYLLQRLIIVG